MPVYRRYEMTSLSQHSMGPKLSHAAVAKALQFDVTTVKYWFKRWKSQRIEVIQFDLVEHRQLLPNKMNKLFLSTNNRHSLQIETLQTT